MAETRGVAMQGRP